MSSSHKVNLASVGCISSFLSPLTIRIGIDKINFRPDRDIDKFEIFNYWEERGIPSHSRISIWIKNKRAVECYNFKFLYSSDLKKIRSILSNPSDFITFDLYLYTLKKLIPPKYLDEIKITHLDIYLDLINKSFQHLKKHIIFKGPRKLERFVYDNVMEASLYAGKNLYRFYNKLKCFNDLGITENYRNTNYKHIVRLEKSYSKKTLPTNSIFELQEALLNIQFNPFKHVYYLDYQIPKQKKYELDKASYALEHSIDLVGIYHAQKYYRSRSDFPLSSVLKIKGDKSTGDYYHAGMTKYFQDGGVYNCKQSEEV